MISVTEVESITSTNVALSNPELDFNLMNLPAAFTPNNVCWGRSLLVWQLSSKALTSPSHGGIQMQAVPSWKPFLPFF